MALEITGKVTQILEVQKGEGRNGPWQRGGFVMEAGDRYPTTVCCQAWGEMLDQVNNLKVGETVKASVDIRSREFNGRWYTDVRPWKLEKIETAPVTPSSGNSDSEPEHITQNIENKTTTPGPESSTEDDLPF